MHKIKELVDYLPHRPPFLLIDELIVVDQDNFGSNTNPEDKPYLTINGVPQETFLIENIAQTCAAASGYFAKESNGTAQIGYIGAVTNLKVSKIPDSPSIINTSVKVLQRFGVITLVEGACYDQFGEQLLVCQMKIVLASDE